MISGEIRASAYHWLSCAECARQDGGKSRGVGSIAAREPCRRCELAHRIHLVRGRFTSGVLIKTDRDECAEKRDIEKDQKCGQTRFVPLALIFTNSSHYRTSKNFVLYIIPRR